MRPIVLLIVPTILLSWLLMQAAHELGHVIHARLCGGNIERVVLHPLTISRTDVSPNPNPVFVAMGGPLWGCTLPLLALAIVRKTKFAYLFKFFAGFCLIANGAYIFGGALYRMGDAVPMLNGGVPFWPLLCCPLLPIVLGLYYWNNLSPQFALGPHARPLIPAHCTTILIVLLLTISLELLFSPSN